MPSLPPDPSPAPHDEDDGVSSSEAHQGTESYHEYRNEDIEILHHVVANAQDSLDQLPERERLPTNALFEAYDAVLPMYGLDPEEDQKISRVVFRIGGERSDGSLLDKFCAVMSRMGIEVQFDTDRVSLQETVDDVDHTRTPSPPTRSVFGQEHSRPTTSVLPLRELRGRVARPGLIGVQGPGQGPGQVLAPTEARGLASDSTAHSSASASILGHISETAAERVYQQYIQSRTTQSSARVERVFLEWRGIALALERQRRELQETGLPRHGSATVQSLTRDWILSVKTGQLDRRERVAQRAREIYLVTTTFARWQEYALDKADRTAVARRHILRLRHFESWKEAALHQEGTIRTFVQGVNLPRWREQSATLVQAEEQATCRYSEATLAKWFGEWHTLALGLLADQWRCRHQRISTFNQWLRQARGVARLDVLAAAQNERTLLAQSMTVWKGESGYRQLLEATSLKAERDRLVCHGNWVWRHDSYRLCELEQSCRRRHVSNDFQMWLVDSRARVLEQAASRRFISEVFRDWRLMARTKAFQRQRDERLVAQTLSLLVTHCAELMGRHGESQLRSASMTVGRATITRSFHLWRELAQEVRQHEQFSNHFVAPATKINYLNTWYRVSTRDPEMQRWAKRGDTYLVVDGGFGMWQTWAKGEKERKLRETYALAKNGANRRFVMSCWRGWRSEARHADELLEGAARQWRVKEHNIQSGVMGLWLNAASQAAHLGLACDQLVTNSLFSLWGGIAANRWLLDDEAWALWAERMADTCWKRWNIAFQWVEGQEYNAGKAVERRQIKLVYESLVLWRQMSSADMAASEYKPRASAPDTWSRNEIPWTTGRRSLAKAQGWSRSTSHLDRQHLREEPIDRESAVGSSPVNTPTRWSGGRASLLPIPSTTPVASLPTPYERELRYRYGGTSSPEGT